MQTQLSPVSQQGSFLLLPFPLWVPWISEYVHLNRAARKEPRHIWFLCCTMCCCSLNTAGKNKVCFPSLPPVTSGKSLHRSQMWFPSNATGIISSSWDTVGYQRLRDGLTLTLQGHVNEVGSTICACVHALLVGGPCHSARFYKMGTTSAFVKITPVCTHTTIHRS